LSSVRRSGACSRESLASLGGSGIEPGASCSNCQSSATRTHARVSV
jgi:hypothetical protein